MRQSGLTILVAITSAISGAGVAVLYSDASLTAQADRCASEYAAFQAAAEAYQSATTDRAAKKAAYDAAGDAYQRCLSAGSGQSGAANRPSPGGMRSSRGSSGTKGNPAAQNASCAELWNAIATYLRMNVRTTQGENAYAQAMQEYSAKCEAGPNGTHIHKGTGDVVIPDFYGEGEGPGGAGSRGGSGTPSAPCSDGAAPAVPTKPGLPGGRQVPGAGQPPMKPGAGPVQGTFGGAMPQGARGAGAPQGGQVPPKRPPADGESSRGGAIY